ncbi:MAG: FAD-dependent oxidoreductase, partial [Silvanigrellaceae bacterium]|nr:FAD-dependent oxidoreductase [Silvanigrellaceae bacterium]
FKEDRPLWFIRAGLFFYDLLSGDGGLPSAKKMNAQEIASLSPYLNQSALHHNMQGAFLYYDALMLDDVIVRIAAHAAKKLGGTFAEDTDVTAVTPLPGGGFKVLLQGSSGEQQTVTTRYIVNATGAWCNWNLLRWQFIPSITCLLNVGSHIVFQKDVVKQQQSNLAATLIQEKDGRVVFFLPWNNHWLLGTTESILSGEPAGMRSPESDKKYLMDTAHEFFNLESPEKKISEIFSGVRCMPLTKKTNFTHINSSWYEDPYHSPFYVNQLDKNISSLSRETVLDETLPGLINIYGGKYTTYRSISQKITTYLARQLKAGGQSLTHMQDSWYLSELMQERPEIFQSSEFLRTL